MTSSYRVSYAAGLAVYGLLVISGADYLRAATITQVAADSSGQSSLVEGTNWSNGLPPSSGNDYVSSRALRTPVSSSDVVFAGDSLTLQSGGAFLFKGLGTSSTITLNGFRLEGTSFVTNYQGTSTSYTLAGSLELADGINNNFLLNNAGNGGGFSVDSSISGLGALGIYSNGSALSSVSMSLTHANNTYSGGTFVRQYAFLSVEADLALGSGDVSVDQGALTLQSGATDNYIDDSANLIFSVGLDDAAINLNFSGVDSVGGLSLDGGTSFLASGTYSASDLNTAYGSNAFTGAGQLFVVPEPASAGTLALGLICLVGIRRVARSM